MIVNINLKHYLAIFILSIFIFVSSISGVSAQMEVTCPNSNPADSNTGVNCAITSSQTNLFGTDSIIVPGITLSRNLVVINADDDETCSLNMQVTDNSPGQPSSLAQVLWVAIYNGTTNYFGKVAAGKATNAKNYQNLYDSDAINLGTILPNSSQTFVWLATLDGETIGNEYQGKKTAFNFDLSFTCGNPPTPTDTPGDDGGGTDPTPTPASGCTDPAPDSAPGNFRIVSQGVNTITLAWDAVAPVTHYALVFTRSDGEKYGANNIGNTTQYTITNLSGGFTYTFEVMGINGCMPGDRSTLTSSTIGGGVVTGRPIGPEGQVLGKETEEQKATSSADESPQKLSEGAVKGATTCVPWKIYLPWILLIAQAGIILVVEHLMRKDHSWKKHLLAVVTTITSIVLFYWLRECECYSGPSLLAWLCIWYWIVSVLLTIILKFFSYAFIEEVKE